jgi:DNA repair photolyase
MSPAVLEDILDLSRTGGAREVFRSYIRHSKGRKVIQWGALGDPFDNIERWQRVGLQLIPIFQKYNQPTRISTKGGLLLQDKEYLSTIAKYPEIFWFAFSTITIDDEVLASVDRMAPNATERLKAMKILTSMGCRASLRMRPILKNVTDTTAKHPNAWRELMHRAREAGAEAVSMEFVFVPGAERAGVKWRWDEIEKITRFPYRKFYKSTSDCFSACLRSSRAWKEELTFAIRDEAHKLGMVFSISDPHWKELNDTGCCCGMTDTDPVFGIWEKKQACQALLTAKADSEHGGDGLIYIEDVIPDWARKVTARSLICVTGPKAITANRLSFADWHHVSIWNNPGKARGPRIYFGGVLEPVGMDVNKNLVYKYAARGRSFKDYGWNVGDEHE